MIRRSFFQVLSSLFLPLPVPKPGASVSPVQSGAVALLASLVRSPSASASGFASTPSLNTGAAESPHFREAITTQAPDSIHTPAASVSRSASAFWSPSATDPEWLRDWLRIPRLEIREDNLPHFNDSHQIALAAEILPRIRTGRSFAFRYLGGSSPGEIRRVLPTSLFSLDLASHYQFLMDNPAEIPESADGPLYLLAWCQHRNAPRTFRLDRIRPVAKHAT